MVEKLSLKKISQRNSHPAKPNDTATQQVQYEKANAFVKRLRCLRVKEIDNKESTDNIAEDYIVDEKNKTAVLTKNLAQLLISVVNRLLN